MAGRTAVILALIALGFLLHPDTWKVAPMGCWVLALVYALLTSHRRIL